MRSFCHFSLSIHAFTLSNVPQFPVTTFGPELFGTESLWWPARRCTLTTPVVCRCPAIVSAATEGLVAGSRKSKTESTTCSATKKKKQPLLNPTRWRMQSAVNRAIANVVVDALLPLSIVEGRTWLHCSLIATCCRSSLRALLVDEAATMKKLVSLFEMPICLWPCTDWRFCCDCIILWDASQMKKGEYRLNKKKCVSLKYLIIVLEDKTKHWKVTCTCTFLLFKYWKMGTF